MRIRAHSTVSRQALSSGRGGATVERQIASRHGAGASGFRLLDSNANGDLTDDPAPQWADKKMPGRGGTEVIIHMGSASVKSGERAFTNTS